MSALGYHSGLGILSLCPAFLLYFEDVFGILYQIPLLFFDHLQRRLGLDVLLYFVFVFVFFCMFLVFCLKCILFCIKLLRCVIPTVLLAVLLAGAAGAGIFFLLYYILFLMSEFFWGQPSPSPSLSPSSPPLLFVSIGLFLILIVPSSQLIVLGRRCPPAVTSSFKILRSSFLTENMP